MARAVAAKDIRETARRVLGLRKLRPGQLEAVKALSEGNDVVAVMPTGWGKSAIYQLAGALLEGPTVIVSPLIALQHDQVDRMEGAVVANSTQGAGVRRDVLQRVSEGQADFVFVAPEQFANPDTMAALATSPPALFVVDEAHCISVWGHDFRPAYLHLAPVIEALGRPITVALTATGSPPVRDEIVQRLGLRNPVIIVKGFDRPNIHLAVRHEWDARQRDEALLDAVAEAQKPGIVYVATRARAEELAEALVARGIKADAYHGGMSGARRDEVQDRFMAGDVDVVTATDAFGLGIDKADVRFVFHAAPSESLDAYYQEVGRAGRDGQPAKAILFWRAEDLGTRRFFAGGPRIERAELERVANLAAVGGVVSLAELAEEAGMRPGRVASAVGWLAREGAVRVGPGGDPVFAARAGEDLAAGSAAAVAAAASRRRLDKSRVDMMRAYAETRTCRRRLLLGYFGQDGEPWCGACDNCDARPGAAAAEDQPGSQVSGSPFAVGARVRHDSLGSGTVMTVEGDTLVVLFEDQGYTSLSTELVLDRDLLRVERDGGG